MKTQTRQENVKILAEVHLSLIKIRKKVRRLNNKMKKCNHTNDHQKFHVVKNYGEKENNK